MPNRKPKFRRIETALFIAGSVIYLFALAIFGASAIAEKKGAEDAFWLLLLSPVFIVGVPFGLAAGVHEIGNFTGTPELMIAYHDFTYRNWRWIWGCALLLAVPVAITLVILMSR
jgi:cell division protein FtsW (lipid II flippase)